VLDAARQEVLRIKLLQCKHASGVNTVEVDLPSAACAQDISSMPAVLTPAQLPSAAAFAMATSSLRAGSYLAQAHVMHCRAPAYVPWTG
jgi:hypothetical protein